jgi:hypothetical protein
MMLDEITHMVGERPGDPIGLLILASMLREDMPWLYELGMEAYRAAKTGLPEDAEKTRRQFQRAVELLRHGPFHVEEMGIDPRHLHMLMRELERSIMIEPPAEEEPKAKPKRKKQDKDGA